MNEEFNLRKERRELFEKELLGKSNAGRIYRKIIAQDDEFIRLLKEAINKGDLYRCVNCKNNLRFLDELAGKELK